MPKVCSAEYDDSTSVFMKSSSYPEDTLQKDCFPNENDKCYEIWKTITCHLAYPKCVENQTSIVDPGEL